MSSGIEIYRALATPPQSALKKITGGRLNGMTDIRPQWRYRAMTEQFGLCGVGWRYTIARQWTEPGPDGEMMAFVDVNLYVKVDGEWSEAIPGTGGSMLIAKESKGLRASDEAYKMATTDALSVAMKMIGVAASVYEGQDISKYSSSEPKPSETKREPLQDYSRMPADKMDAKYLPKAIKQAIGEILDESLADGYRSEAKDAYDITDEATKITEYRKLLANIREYQAQQAHSDVTDEQEPELPDGEGGDLF